MLQRAQQTLAHRLGVLPQGECLIDEALKDYLTLYEGPLPQEVIVVLARLFKLDYHLTTEADNALIKLVGQGGCDLGTPDSSGPSITSTSPMPPTPPVGASAVLPVA